MFIVTEYAALKKKSVYTDNSIYSVMILFKELFPLNIRYVKPKARKTSQSLLLMGLVATKPVFRVSDKVRFKPACSATETS